MSSPKPLPNDVAGCAPGYIGLPDTANFLSADLAYQLDFADFEKCSPAVLAAFHAIVDNTDKRNRCS